ncbi:hypothetical protein O3G_MSEX015028 [Manduca sexta]|uniref:Uncharacterized protein n=1 Tax=Manduca sexta TaxID=7130 RepID=A0A921ZVY4_MANSE|nr:hypothetical protein O3G_MSEX015028 [Manduca sexta]
MLLWVGSAAPAQFTADVFGVSSPQQLDPQVCELPDRHNATSQAVRAILHDAREKRRSCMRLTIMRQHDKLETVLRHFLVEDRGVDGSPLVRGLPVPRTQGDPAAALAAPRGRARRRPRLREVVSRHNWYTMSPMYNTGLLIEIKKNRNCIVMTSVD